MAPTYHLMNFVLLAADASWPGNFLSKSCARFRAQLLGNPKKIADRFYLALGRRRKTEVITYSYSSTVVKALIHARRRIKGVTCSEGRPGMEGRKTAAMLAKAGIRVTLVSDINLPLFFGPHEDPFGYLLVVGADQVNGGGIVNKVGTELLLERAHRFGAPAWILADSAKFVPSRALHLSGASCLPQSLWPDAPRRITVYGGILSPARIFPSTRLLTERGWMTPARVQRVIAKIKLSPRVKELVDCDLCKAID